MEFRERLRKPTKKEIANGEYPAGTDIECSVNDIEGKLSHSFVTFGTNFAAGRPHQEEAWLIYERGEVSGGDDGKLRKVVEDCANC